MVKSKYIKMLKMLHKRIKKYEDKKQKTIDEYMKYVKREKSLWVKKDICEICNHEGYTEWHHIISQNRCRESDMDFLVYCRSNVIEVCKFCHDNTTASLMAIGNRDGKSVRNKEGPATHKQIEYIKKLGGSPKSSLTRQEASKMIDKLKGGP